MTVRRWASVGAWTAMALAAAAVLVAGRVATSVPPAADVAAGMLALLALVAASVVVVKLRHRRGFGRVARLRSLAYFAMSTRAAWPRDVLAATSSRGRWDYDGLVENLLRSGGDGIGAMGRDRDALDALGLLGHVVASQQLRDDDAEAALAIARAVATAPRGAAVHVTTRQALAQLLLAQGDIESVRVLVAPELGRGLLGRLLALDAMNPYVGDHERERAWLTELGRVFARSNLTPVTVEAGPGVPFDRLRATASSPPARGPLVSVIMTVFNSEPAELRTAVQSVIDQTWQDWELILVDDASNAATRPFIADLVELDPRIRAHRLPRNSGTYVARNEGLRLARGEFATFHDSDDWDHPQRLEFQARHLMRSPEALANLAQMARVTPQLLFSQARGIAVRLCESSIMVRREAVLDAVGYFDPVRKGADSGFRKRISAAAGRELHVIDMGAPLVLVRAHGGTLSGADIRAGWMHPARTAYANAVDRWIELGGRRLSGETSERPYAVPPHIEGRRDVARELDIVYVLDPTRAVEGQLAAAHDDEIEAATASGLRAGLLYGRIPRVPDSGPRTRGRIQDLVNAGAVIEVFPGDHVRARLVVVLGPASLLGLPGDLPPLVAERVLVAGHPGDDAPGTWADDVTAVAVARRLTVDVTVEQVALSDFPVVRASLRR